MLNNTDIYYSIPFVGDMDVLLEDDVSSLKLYQFKGLKGLNQFTQIRTILTINFKNMTMLVCASVSW